jgi:hypothetical protein
MLFWRSICIASLNSCGHFGSYNVVIENAMIERGREDSLLPAHFLENSGLGGRVYPVSIHLRGKALLDIYRPGSIVYIRYLDCQSSREVDSSLGPFFNRRYFNESTTTSEIVSSQLYEISGTIAISTVRSAANTCVVLLGFDRTGNRFISNQIRLQMR